MRSSFSYKSHKGKARRCSRLIKHSYGKLNCKFPVASTVNQRHNNNDNSIKLYGPRVSGSEQGGSGEHSVPRLNSK